MITRHQWVALFYTAQNIRTGGEEIQQFVDVLQNMGAKFVAGAGVEYLLDEADMILWAGNAINGWRIFELTNTDPDKGTANITSKVDKTCSDCGRIIPAGEVFSEDFISVCRICGERGDADMEDDGEGGLFTQVYPRAA